MMIPSFHSHIFTSYTCFLVCVWWGNVMAVIKKEKEEREEKAEEERDTKPIMKV